jgi:uncharacterized repeat protein (TIGR02543 family)
MAHDVFISYSTQDKAIADAACATLESRKIRCWIAPRDVVPGLSYAEALIDAINRSCIMVLVFSASANSSPQVIREVERAVNKGIQVIPFRIENVTPSKAIEYFLSAPQWLDALTPPLEKHLQRLADTVQALLTEVEKPRREGVEPEPPVLKPSTVGGEAMSFCPDCGTQVSEDGETRFCPECGRRLVIGQAVKGKSKKKLAGIIVACTIAIIVIVVIATRPPTPLAQICTLTTNISPSGAGFIYPSGGEYESGVQVTLTASPASGYTFDYWSGSASGTTSTITITMDSDKSLTAHFKTIPTVPEVLFSDDFSDETGVWDTFSDENGSIFYENGWLHLVDYTTGSVATCTFGYQYFTDFILEVETKLVGGTGNNWHTVLCRYQDNDNYYDFGISADGYYAIVKYIGGDQVLLTGSAPIYSSYINQGVDAVNLIHIECIGSDLSLSVNGHLLEEVTDATFSDGDIVLVATSLGSSFTEIAFDNIIVTEPFETIPTVPEVLFSDDFSDESSGWVTYDGYDGRDAYLNGCLYIKDYTAYEGSMYSESQRYFTDFILEVETWLVGGTDYNWHVVYCRWMGEGNYYAFGISADGYYDIEKWVDGNVISLVVPTYSSYINQGVGAVNLIHIECIGSDLSLSVNGHLLEEVTDTTFSGGDISLAANALAGTFTEVAFDNIVVSEP